LIEFTQLYGLNTQRGWHTSNFSTYILPFYVWYIHIYIIFFSNPTGLFCTHGRCSICAAAEDRKKQTGNVASAQTGCARTTLSRQFKQNVTIARNNNTRDKFHSLICSKLYFVVLKHFKCIIE